MCKNFAETDRLLAADNISFSLSGRTLLKEISLSLPQGKLTVMIGPNGAGKSTLMRLLSGYLIPDSGECRLHQRPMSQWQAAELANVRAVMRQHSQLNFPFSVEEVIQMGGYHRPKQQVMQHLDCVIDIADCQTLRDKPYRALSGGEQQRAQLARALLQLWSETMQGKILFLDEPTSAFDLYHQQHCLRLMSQLCREKGLSVCCILHDLNLASLYADHLILLAEQRIQAQGSPHQVLSNHSIQRWYKADVTSLPHHQAAVPQFQLKQ